jgi:hypothetical protein
MESIDRRELNYAGGLIEKTFMNKSFDIDGETIAYRVINCQIQE